jgi:hypothetical protein
VKYTILKSNLLILLLLALPVSAQAQTFNFDNSSFKGDRNAKLTTVLFIDYQ